MSEKEDEWFGITYIFMIKFFSESFVAIHIKILYVEERWLRIDEFNKRYVDFDFLEFVFCNIRFTELKYHLN